MSSRFETSPLQCFGAAALVAGSALLCRVWTGDRVLFFSLLVVSALLVLVGILGLRRGDS